MHLFSAEMYVHDLSKFCCCPLQYPMDSNSKFLSIHCTNLVITMLIYNQCADHAGCLWQVPQQDITWTNVVLSKKFCSIQLRAIAQMLMNLIHNMCSEIILLRLLTHLSGGKELNFILHPHPAGDRATTAYNAADKAQCRLYDCMPNGTVTIVSNRINMKHNNRLFWLGRQHYIP